MVTLAEKLKQLREEKGLSKHRLCILAQLGQAAVYQIEEGITTTPSYKTLYRLSKVLEVPVDSWAHYMEDTILRGYDA